MRKIFRKIMILTMFCFIIFASGKAVHAATANIIASKSAITVGESVTIRVNMTAASWNLHVGGSASKSIVGYSDDGENITKTESISFKPKSKGTYTITLSGDVTDGKTLKTTSVSGSVTINVKEKSSNNNSSNNSNSGQSNTTSNNSSSNNSSNNNSQVTSSKSNVATLKNLGIRPNDFSGFRAAITSYSVKVPNTLSKVNIYATATNSKATVSGTGTKNLKEGKNTFSVKVTAEDKKTTKTYTLNITREEKKEESNDATLKNFGMRPNDFKGFKPTKTNYSVEVPNTLNKINIYATAKNSKSAVSGTGTKNLKEGKNTFSVKVTAEDKKTTKTYTLEVVRKEAEEKDEEPEESVNEKKADGLTNIEVSGYTISPRFNNEIYEYNLDIEDETKLDIITNVSSSIYEVEIVGNEKFDVGENVITILVRNIKNDKVTTYQLIANVPEKEIDVAGVNSVIADAQNVINRKQWLIIGTAIAVILLIIIFIIYRCKLRKNRKYDEYEDDDEIVRDRINLDEEDIFNRASKISAENDSNINSFENEDLPPSSFNFQNSVKVEDDELPSGLKFSNDTTIPKEDHELDDFENLDNLEEILRKRKSEK